MSAVLKHPGISESPVNRQNIVARDEAAIVVVGTGPVGMHFVEELLKRTCSSPVVVYGNEPCKPYDRVRLSSYLAGEIIRDELNIEARSPENARIEYRFNCPVTWIDRRQKIIVDKDGAEQKYSKLVLATGSEPFIPFFGNNSYAGIYTFRTLVEADELLARRTRTSHTVILGGGLLGLETARAMQKNNTQITIIEHSKWLMMSQLDEEGAGYLEDHIKKSGINVVLDDSIVSVVGKQRVEAVSLRSGREITCDTLIVAAGIRPNIQLAMDARLSCRKGIRINDRLQTSDENIFAIGECAEHNNAVYGLVKPGLEQGMVLADRIAGGNSHYIGSLESTRLKVINQSVFSSGRTGVDEDSRTSVREHIYTSKHDGVYRKIRVIGNRIIGVIAVGDWHETALIQDSIQKKRTIWWWQIIRFWTSGVIWAKAEDLDVSSWPSSAVVCNCMSVTRGRLSSAIEKGCETVACLQTETRASSVCGTCRPLLAEMLGEDTKLEPVLAWRSLLAVSALTLSLAALFFFIWRIPYPESVQVPVRWDVLWRDPLIKQISGFAMLGLIIAGLAISMRKRLKNFTAGDFNYWRIVHAALGIAALISLIAHTGFRLGNELNLVLMLNFLLLAAAGANASTVISTEHQQVPSVAKKQRKRWNWIHLLLFWPMPVLLGFHVAKTYYF